MTNAQPQTDTETSDKPAFPRLATKSLFGIGADFQALDQLLEEIGGDVSDPSVAEAIDTWMAENLAAQKGKIDAYYAVYAEAEARADALKAEAARLTEAARTELNKAARLKERLKLYMLGTGQDRIEGRLHKAVLAKDSGRKKLDIDSGVTLPQELMVPKTTYGPDRELITAKLEAGEEIPGCQLLPVERSLSLK
jgi:hypothetical protein